MDEKKITNKNNAASTKKIKSTQKPKWKRRVTFNSSAENMGNLTITQKVRVKKQKIKCIINLTNICQMNEKPIKSDAQKSNTPGDRIVPHCLRKLCKRTIKSKIKQHKQEVAQVKEYPKVANSSKGKKRAHTNNPEESWKSSKRFKSDGEMLYEDISSDSLDLDDKLDSLYVDSKLETLIIRTKARERSSETTKASYPKPLHTSTPIREVTDDYEDIVSSSANMDHSINSQDTLILEPKLELLSPQNLKEHCFASEQNFDPLKVCSSSDFYQESFHINGNTPENLVISVDPFVASNGWEVFSQSDANQVFLDINSLSPKNTIIPKEPAFRCKQEHNQVSEEFLDNCVLSLKNIEEVSCITPCNQGSGDTIADYKTNVNHLFVDNKTESFPSSSKNTTHCYLELNKHNAIIMNPTKSHSGNKSNIQSLTSINLLSSENENNALFINVPFKSKEPYIQSIRDNFKDTKADSGIDFNQNSLHDKIPKISDKSVIDNRKQDSDYVTAESESEVNNLDLDKSVTCKEPVIACVQISHKNPEDSLNNNTVFSNKSAVSNESTFRKNDSEDVKYKSGISLVEPLVVQSLKLINAFSPNKLEIFKDRPVVNRKHVSSENINAVFGNNVSQCNHTSSINIVKPLVVQSLNLINALSPNKLEIFEKRSIVNRKQVSENINADFANDVNRISNYPKVSATSKEPAIDRVDHNSSSSDLKDGILSDVNQNLLDDKSLSTNYSDTSEKYVHGDLHSKDVKTSNESAGKQAALGKSSLNKNAEIPVEPSVAVVYMAQNTEKPIFSIDHCYQNSDVPRLENNSDEPKKPMEPSLEPNSKEPSAPGLEQITQASPEPSLEQNSLEPTEISLQQNSRELSETSVKQNYIEPSELGLENYSKDLFEPIFERNSKEQSESNLKQVSAEPGLGSPEKNFDRLSVGSFEHYYEEPALDNIEQIVKETAFANPQQNTENITPVSVSKVIHMDFEENPISQEHNVTEKFIKNVPSLKYNSKILPVAVVITEESTVIDLTKDFEEANTNTQQDSALEINIGSNQRLTAISKQSLDGKAAGSGRNDGNILSDNTPARDNTMLRNHAMTNCGLNSIRNNNIDDEPKCIPTGPKKPPIQNIKLKPETSSTSEYLRSLSSTNNNPNQRYLDRAIENQFSALNRALSIVNQYRPANVYGQQPYSTMYPNNNIYPVPSQFNVRTNSSSPIYGNSFTNYKYEYQSYAYRNGYNANRPYRNRPFRNRPYHRPNLQAIQNTTHSTTGSIVTPHKRVNLESNSVKLAGPVSVKYEPNSVKLPGHVSVKYEPNMIKQETTDDTCKAESNNITVKRENFDSPETNSFVANQSVMNDNLIRFIKKEPLD